MCSDTFCVVLHFSLTLTYCRYKPIIAKANLTVYSWSTKLFFLYFVKCSSRWGMLQMKVREHKEVCTLSCTTFFFFFFFSTIVWRNRWNSVWASWTFANRNQFGWKHVVYPGNIFYRNASSRYEGSSLFCSDYRTESPRCFRLQRFQMVVQGRWRKAVMCTFFRFYKDKSNWYQQ